MSTVDYHLRELSIALDPNRPHHVLPELPATATAVLDVGCGVGQTLIAIDARERAAGEASPRTLCGVDVDVEALAAGNVRWPHLRLAAACGEALPYPDAQFDYVICRVALPYMAIHRALAEFHRVLRPGGTLWLTLHPAEMTLRELGAAVRGGRWKNVIYRSYVLANGALFHLTGVTARFPLARARTESWQSLVGARRALARAGFRDVQTTMSGEARIVTARR